MEYLYRPQIVRKNQIFSPGRQLKQIIDNRPENTAQVKMLHTIQRSTNRSVIQRELAIQDINYPALNNVIELMASTVGWDTEWEPFVSELIKDEEVYNFPTIEVFESALCLFQHIQSIVDEGKWDQEWDQVTGEDVWNAPINMRGTKKKLIRLLNLLSCKYKQPNNTGACYAYSLFNALHRLGELNIGFKNGTTLITNWFPNDNGGGAQKVNQKLVENGYTNKNRGYYESTNIWKATRYAFAHTMPVIIGVATNRTNHWIYAIRLGSIPQKRIMARDQQNPDYGTLIFKKFNGEWRALGRAKGKENMVYKITKVSIGTETTAEKDALTLLCTGQKAPSCALKK